MNKFNSINADRIDDVDAHTYIQTNSHTIHIQPHMLFAAPYVELRCNDIHITQSTTYSAHDRRGVYCINEANNCVRYVDASLY